MAAKVLILIPARYNSSRFPGKPLAKIAGLPMIEHVYKNVNEASGDFESTTCVVTDDERIEKCVQDFSGRVVRVDDDVPSGSERILLAYERFFSDQNFDLIVNVQGDEPLLKSADLSRLISYHLSQNIDMGTMVFERNDRAGYEDANCVKCVWVEDSGACLYFSRSSVPANRSSGDIPKWYQHIGVYSYKISCLRSYGKWNTGVYEAYESLEQLRALENGALIGAVKIDKKLIGVDTPEDIKRVEGELN